MRAVATSLAAGAYCNSRVGDAWLQPRVEQARDLILAGIPDSQVEGLILTGSLARGEASVLLENNRLRLLGDLEFLVIVRRQRQWRRFRRQLDELGRRVTERLSAEAAEFPVECTPADISYLRERARPSIFTYDLYSHGRVVYGRPDLRGEIPAFPPSAIPPEDAVHTLLNRGVELLASADDAPVPRAYRLAKTLLDAAGSALAFAGSYVSLYEERPRAFRALLTQKPDLASRVEPIERLATLVENASRIKLAPTVDGLLQLSRQTNAQEVLGWILGLWRWEVGCATGTTGTSTDSLISAYLAAEASDRRLRNWVKYAWHPLRPAAARLRSRALPLVTRASPRRLVYAAALLAIEGAPGWEERAARLLPFEAVSRHDTLRQIIGTWKWLVRND